VATSTEVEALFTSLRAATSSTLPGLLAAAKNLQLAEVDFRALEQLLTSLEILSVAAVADFREHLFRRSQNPPIKPVFKFGYGSNISPAFLRNKKDLDPIYYLRGALKGFSLSFPKGKGIDYVEPSFATLRRDPEGMVHGVATLLDEVDKDKLDQQERGYKVEVCKLLVYDSDEAVDVEVYVPKNERPAGDPHPQGCCSERYRDILVNGAEEMKLSTDWVAKLRDLPVYKPSTELLLARTKLPPVESLPTMTITELAALPSYSSSCGLVFEVNPPFKLMKGRDVTIRNSLHASGVNIDTNDNGGRSPFPVLAEMEPKVLEYCLCYRDRFNRGGAPVAALREFWGEQRGGDLEGVYRGNVYGK